jgi:hypothetical protein
MVWRPKQLTRSHCEERRLAAGRLWTLRRIRAFIKTVEGRHVR